MIGVYLLEGAYLGKVFLNTQGAEPDADSRGNMQMGSTQRTGLTDSK